MHVIKSQLSLSMQSHSFSRWFVDNMKTPNHHLLTDSRSTEVATCTTTLQLMSFFLCFVLTGIKSITMTTSRKVVDMCEGILCYSKNSLACQSLINLMENTFNTFYISFKANIGHIWKGKYRFEFKSILSHPGEQARSLFKLIKRNFDQINEHISGQQSWNNQGSLRNKNRMWVTLTFCGVRKAERRGKKIRFGENKTSVENSETFNYTVDGQHFPVY